MYDTFVKTGYALCKDGYIMPDGKEIYSETILEARTKEELVKYAKKKKLNPDEHYIETIGYELVYGLKSPDSLGDYDYLNNYNQSKPPRRVAGK